MTATRKPQRFLVPWLKGRFRWQERLARIEWSADDVVTMTEVTTAEGEPDTLIFSVPARDFVRANLTIGYLRLFLGDGRNVQLNVQTSVAVPEDGDTVESYAERAQGHGVAAPEWWMENLQAAGVPVRVRGSKWFTGVVIGTTVGIVAAATVLVLLVG